MFVDGKVVKQFGVTGILALLKWTQGVKSLYSDGEMQIFEKRSFSSSS